MPTLTFYNLPEEKKQKLVAAAEQEFSRVPVYEASIANIVKQAGIPRGSFYQYFEGKEDAYFFLLNMQAQKRQHIFYSLLEEHRGNLFNTMTEMYAILLKEIPGQENLQFLKHAFLNRSHRVEQSLSEMFSYGDDKEMVSSLKDHLNMTLLNIESDSELAHLMQIIIAVTMRNMMEKFSRNLSDKQALENYKTELTMLQRGLCR
ncbi:TetR/AcrR family transcriptional regulator [Oceanobacillus kapialis]|uniref:TetR/AcrR family transcriptional regulator n=1 Tax=Oceanobacillus kapialis TaxID=481353 RepID=A0ABW5Q3F6_9BACI